MANNTSGFQGDEFSNNLFSDLGPLLALFGERVATQYLRHSTCKLESLIFACAPLGILTAVTSAIRVGGSRKLKAMIGRAEESDAVAETELLSSTSTGVCELWNGAGLVRIIGKPHILELLIDNDLLSGNGSHQAGFEGSGESTSSENPVHAYHGLYTRKEGLQPVEVDLESVDKSIPESIAPNISLNTTGGFTSSWEVYIVAVIGVIVQLAVLAVDAVITYKWGLEKGGRAVAGYAFPLTCIGTLGLVFGMYLCASIIEVSTKELQWLPNSGSVTENNSGNKRFRILWVQKGQTVGDQGFGSYAIYAPSESHSLMTSHRRPEADLNLHGLTIMATAVSFGDSLRAMHYSASIAQLVATIVMTVLRVAIRRHISQEPQQHTHATENEVQAASSDPRRSNEFELTPTSGPNHQPQEQHPARYAVQELTDGHELDIIAMQLQKCKLWQVVTFWGPDQDTRLPQDTPTGKLAENVLETRIRLTALLQSPWQTKIGEQAKILSETMADVMNSLWNSEGVLGNMPKLTADSAFKEDLSWKIPIEIQPNYGTINNLDSIPISLRRKQLADDKWKPWEVDVTQVEAVLQLWMLRLSTYTEGDGNVLWLLCPDDDYKAAMIADWWIGKEAGSVSDKALEDICKDYNISYSQEGYEGSPSTEVNIRNYIIGCVGLNSDTSVPASTPMPVDNKGNHITRAIVQNMGLGIFAAQYIVYTFLAHLVQSIEDVTTPTVVRDEQATGPLLRNDTITDLAVKVQERGLCTVAEAYRMVLCAFAANSKLPIPYQQSGDPFLVLYQKALERGHRHKGESNQGSPAALKAQKIHEEAVKLCGLEALQLLNRKRWAEAGKLVVRAARISESYFTAAEMDKMRGLMHLVGSKFDFPPSEDLTAASAEGINDMPPETMSSLTELMKAACSQDAYGVHKLLLASVKEKPEESAELEVFKTNCKLRALDYAAQLGHKEVLILLQLYGTLLSGAPLWWAVDGVRNKGRTEDECVDVLKLLLDFGHDPNRLEPKEGESPLHLAAKLNLMKAMETLLAKVELPSTRSLASVDLKDQNGLSNLYHAVKECHGAMAKLLIDHGANVKGETGPGQKSLVHYAAIHGDRVMLKIMHENGGDIEAFDIEGKNPLYYAAKCGSNELLETLLGMGADINRKCPQPLGGRTALHWMALEGNAGAIRILLENQVNLDEGDEDGKTALHYATKEGQKAAVYVLLEKGASLDMTDTAGKIPAAYAKDLPDGELANDIVWMLDHGSDMKLDDQKWTALHRAASKSPGDEVAAEILLRCGADVEAMGATGSTSIQLAALNGYERIVQVLLDNGAAVNTQNIKLWAPLHKATYNSHERVVQMLLDNGAAVNTQHQELWTPLHQAAFNGHERIVQMLLDKEAEVNVKHDQEWTPLHQAANKGHERIVQMLLDKEADVNVKDNEGCTPLHHAAGEGHERVVQMLLDKEAEVNVKHDEGWTPLHYAAHGGHVEIIRALLHRGADLDASTDVGKTPLHVATLAQQLKSIQFLIENGANLRAIDTSRQIPEYYATRPFKGYEINPDVAEVFRALRNRSEGATTNDEGKRAPDAVTGGDSAVKEVKDMDAGPLVAPQLVPTPEDNANKNETRREHVTELVSSENELDVNESGARESEDLKLDGNDLGDSDLEDPELDDNE